MSKLSILPIRATLAGRWQIPTLVAGLCLFSSGLIRIAAAHETVTFEQHVDRVHTLQQAGALTRANAYLLYLLKDPERPALERGELHRLVVGTIHLAETRYQKTQTGESPGNHSELQHGGSVRRGAAHG